MDLNIFNRMAFQKSKLFFSFAVKIGVMDFRVIDFHKFIYILVIHNLYVRCFTFIIAFPNSILRISNIIIGVKKKAANYLKISGLNVLCPP